MAVRFRRLPASSVTGRRGESIATRLSLGCRRGTKRTPVNFVRAEQVVDLTQRVGPRKLPHDSVRGPEVARSADSGRALRRCHGP